MDPITLLMLAVLAVLIFFMFRNSRKRQRDAAALKEQMVVGTDVMTNSGVYGTILSIDEEANQVMLETTPGTVLRLHRQTISRVVEPVVEGSDDVDGIDVDGVTSDIDGSDIRNDMSEPEFGQRLDDTDNPSSSKPDKD